MAGGERVIIPEFGVRSRRVTEVSAHSSLEPGCGDNWEHLAFSFCVRFSPCLCTCSSLCLELPFPLYWPIDFVFIFQGSVLPSRSLGSSLIHDTASGTSPLCSNGPQCFLLSSAFHPVHLQSISFCYYRLSALGGPTIMHIVISSIVVIG